MSRRRHLFRAFFLGLHHWFLALAKILQWTIILVPILGWIRETRMGLAYLYAVFLTIFGVAAVLVVAWALVTGQPIEEFYPR